MSDDISAWIKSLGVVGGALVGLSAGILLFIRLLVNLKSTEAEKVRRELQTRIESLETKLDKSITDCEERMRLLRAEYDGQVETLREENTLLRIKISRLEIDMTEVKEKTAEFVLPKKP